jgi:hypothetical protein
MCCRKRPLSVKEFLTVHQINLLPHTAFLQICHLAIFFLFQRLKRTLKGYRCADIQHVQTGVTKQLYIIPERVFQACFEDPRKEENRILMQAEAIPKEILSTRL